jgi:hypothetical protein
MLLQACMTASEMVERMYNYYDSFRFNIAN